MTTDETEIVTADKKGCLRIWERSPAANLLYELTTPTPVKRLKLTPRLLIALCATEIIAWQRSDYKRLEELKFPKVDSDAQIECDEELLALLNDNRVQIIDLKEGKIKRGFSNDDKIYAIALRQGVLAIAEGRSIFCKNLKTDRTEIRRLPYLLQNCVTALCCDESGAVACINSRGDAGLWEKDTIESPSKEVQFGDRASTCLNSNYRIAFDALKIVGGNDYQLQAFNRKKGGKQIAVAKIPLLQNSFECRGLTLIASNREYLEFVELQPTPLKQESGWSSWIATVTLPFTLDFTEGIPQQPRLTYLSLQALTVLEKALAVPLYPVLFPLLTIKHLSLKRQGIESPFLEKIKSTLSLKGAAAQDLRTAKPIY
jgi:hypothetical protein